MHKENKLIPHVHAEVIKQWASGDQIEWSDSADIWHETLDPSWNVLRLYRVKPKPPKDIELYARASAFHGMDTSLMISAYSLLTNFSTDFNLIDNLKLVFCGVTGKLLQAELVKHEKADDNE